MNIALLGHFDIASLVALNRIATALVDDTVQVFLSSAQPDDGSGHAAMRHLAAVDGALCHALLERSDVATALRRAQHLPKPNGADGLALLNAAGGDLVVSVRYRRILHEAAIAIPRHGVINLHSGILPDYRGVMATFWALLNGEAEIGSTLHRIDDAGIDTGAIISIDRQHADPERSYLWNVLNLYGPGCGAILSTIDTIRRAGAPRAASQSMAAGRYFSTPGHSDIDTFLRAGGILADDTESGHPILVHPHH